MMTKSKFDQIVEDPNFCAYPFVQISTVPAGFMRPCCFYAGTLKNDDSSNANVSTNTFQNVWNNADFKKIRSQMISGKVVRECKQCHVEDSFGGDSMRKRSLREWSWRSDFRQSVEQAISTDGRIESSVKFLELKPGNLCNLKCRMCNQFDSSKYASELKEIGAQFKGEKLTGNPRIFDEHNFEFDFDLSKMADWRNNTHIWSSFEKLAPELEVLSFAGGEPTLIEEVYKALKFCVENSYAKNITVYFASNFTQKMDRFLELAKNFKRFDFIASLDGKDHVQEYIRFPSKWSEVVENFAKTTQFASQHKAINVMVNMTLNIYNILYFTEFLTWLEQDAFRAGLKEDPYNLNILMYPEYLSHKLLPDSLRTECLSKIQKYADQSWVVREKPHIAARIVQLKEMIASKPEADINHQRLLGEFWIYTKILDQSRKQSFAKSFSALSEAIEENLKGFGFEFAKARENFKIPEI